MCDIACGKQHAGLESFSASVDAVPMPHRCRTDAAPMQQWRILGLYDPGTVSGWGDAFYQVMNNTLAAGGKVHINLDGVDVADALAGEPDEFVGRYTEFELQQITLNADWFANTRFYLGDKVLTIEELEEIGITAP